MTQNYIKISDSEFYESEIFMEKGSRTAELHRRRSVRGPHAADSDIPPDVRCDGASALQCGVYGTAFGVPRIPGPQRDYDGIISPVVRPGHAPGDQGICPQEVGNGGT